MAERRSAISADERAQLAERAIRRFLARLGFDPAGVDSAIAATVDEIRREAE